MCMSKESVYINVLKVQTLKKKIWQLTDGL
jgi:hypothetical protein